MGEMVYVNKGGYEGLVQFGVRRDGVWCSVRECVYACKCVCACVCARARTSLHVCAHM